MSTSHKPLDALAVGLMLLLCICWGLQQVAVKVALPIMPSTLQIALRSGAAALLVCVFMLWHRTEFSLSDGTLWPGMVAGVLFAGEFLCVSIGLNYTTASHMSVFLYSAPIFTVLALHWLVPGERLRLIQWLGVLLAFVGIVIALAAGFFDGDATRASLSGDVLGLLAALFWAVTIIVIKTTCLSTAAPSKTLLYQLGMATVLLLGFALATGQASIGRMTDVTWLSLFFQTVVIAFVSFLTWFWMLRRYLASRLTVFSFLTPLFGVGFGVLLLDDPVGWPFAIGAALVLAGIVMVNLRQS
ncbi:DMT family transporter [Glaciimonas immobilis]|uniref:Drug/metabolite transporter (DMT)-like permease n=1 Tax=Glaciimonas immobilis TaxID=728004 RepID=A0A840RPR5_9BURK|nr:DMT family transporter [Glaciimonas immobilis]KAF3996900.1 DMT family transporter [Glaciimonas immobilis]MBB5199713.1 drug/metabolite transporter (DMT)-like permease [Glaciimonas immobilis]